MGIQWCHILITIIEFIQMKLSELRRPLNELKQSELHNLRELFKHGTNIQNELLKNGWNPLGRGAYSIVFEHPSSPYVIKVLRYTTSTRNIASLRCGVSWLRFCQKNYHTNPHLLQVYYVQTRKQKSGVKYYAVIEKLKPIDDSKLRKLANATADLIALYMMDNGAFISDFIGYHTIKYLDDLAATQGGEGTYEERIKNNINKMFEENIKKNHQLSIAVQALLKVGEQYSCYDDLHPGNVMLRRGTLVFTDPFEG